MKQFQGVFPALLTPFREDGHIHEAALQQVVRYNLEKGVTGFYRCV